jgi:2-methylisocitrate lyase-like PEP mutase family enzyme
MIEGGKTPILTPSQLQPLGYKVVFWPCTALYAVLKTLEEVFGQLQKTGTTLSVADRLHSFHEFNQLVGLNEYSALEIKYGVKKIEEESQ